MAEEETRRARVVFRAPHHRNPGTSRTASLSAQPAGMPKSAASAWPYTSVPTHTGSDGIASTSCAVPAQDRARRDDGGVLGGQPASQDLAFGSQPAALVIRQP